MERRPLPIHSNENRRLSQRLRDPDSASPTRRPHRIMRPDRAHACRVRTRLVEQGSAPTCIGMQGCPARDHFEMAST